MSHRGTLFPIRGVIAFACTGALSLIFSGTAAGQQAKTLPVFEDGQAQIVPGFQDPAQWIREQLWVETEFDSDGDGKRDRVHVDVTRPKQTETEGLKVPVIYESSPYFGGVRTEIAKFWDVKQEVGAISPSRPPAPAARTPMSKRIISMSYADIWVPRGFAVIHSESPGTGESEGCVTVGGTNESLAPKAVIDWLNGRAKGFTTAAGNDPVVASWSTGKVGMTGISYNGILSLAAATTGVEGLKAIIPVSAVSSWYEYYRSNGLVRSPYGYLGEDVDVMFDAVNTGRKSGYCAAAVRDSVLHAKHDRTSGDYNDFWASRDYLAKVRKIKAAVLVAHGLSDWNTMPEQGIRIYEALKQQRVPLQLYLGQGGHGAEPPLAMQNRWFTRYLYDVANGVEKDPRVQIENADGGSLTPYNDYPNPAAASVTLHLQAGGVRLGGLGLAARAGQGKETFTDDAMLYGMSVLAQAERDSHRLLYATPVLTEAVHLSGRSKISIRLAANKPAANLSVYLVALPVPRDSAHQATIITRGWADPQNYKSISKGEPLVPGQFYTLNFDLQSGDQVVPAGSRIGLMIFSSDRAFTLWPQAGTELTIDVDSTSIALPVVGGAATLKRAFGSAAP